MRIAVCDDEKIFLEQIQEVLQNFSQIEQMELFDDLHMLFSKLKDGAKYDVIFMDIEWNHPNKNGIDYAAKINEEYPDIQIIYITAYNDRFSQKIFWEPVNLCGYLVKPIKKENLGILFKKAEKNIARLKRNNLIVHYKGVAETIPFHNIQYIESNAHQLLFYLRSDVITVYDKLDDYESKLQPGFVRIHKSFLVNMDYIKRIERNEVTLKSGKALPISKTRSQYVRDCYFNYMEEEL